MPTLTLFEFNDHPAIPWGIRETLLEQLECCNTVFRPYFQQVADQVVEFARKHQLKTVVELGAGAAPLTRLMAGNERSAELSLVACDLYPNVETYQELEEEFPDQVTGLTEPVDFGKVRQWDPGTVLVICSAMHHVPAPAREEVIKNLTASADRVMVFEPVRKTPFSMFLVIFAVIPPLLLPLLLLRRRGRLRRFLYCWLIPVVPAMVLWDALVGCMRQWNTKDWQAAFDRCLDDTRQAEIRNHPHSQVVTW